MMGTIILFNYLPGAVIFRHAMTLFLEEYKEYINKYLRTHYLDPVNPHKLGGRAAGPQGQVGSTNGAERRCGVWQTLCAELKRVNAGDAPNNFVRVLEGETPQGKLCLSFTYVRMFACSNIRMCVHMCIFVCSNMRMLVHAHKSIRVCRLSLTRSDVAMLANSHPSGRNGPSHALFGGQFC